MVFIRIGKNRLSTFGISILSFYLKQHAFALVSNDEVHFKSTFPSDFSSESIS